MILNQKTRKILCIIFPLLVVVVIYCFGVLAGLTSNWIGMVAGGMSSLSSSIVFLKPGRVGDLQI